MDIIPLLKSFTAIKYTIYTNSSCYVENFMQIVETSKNLLTNTIVYDII